MSDADKLKSFCLGEHFQFYHPEWYKPARIPLEVNMLLETIHLGFEVIKGCETSVIRIGLKAV